MNEQANIPALTALFHWKRSLTAAEQQEVAAALRQDPAIWESIQEEWFASQAVSDLGNSGAGSKAWTPAALALLALRYPADASELSTNPNLTIDFKLLPNAIKAFEQFPFQPAETPALIKLQNAGLIALLLRERRRKTGSWQGLVYELLKNKITLLSDWATPLACTMGLISDPDEFLAALLARPAQIEKNAPEQSAAALVQVVLRNPLSIEEQRQVFQNIFRKKLVHPGLVLEILGIQRPELASQLARWLLTEDQNFTTLTGSAGSYFPHEDLLTSIRNLIWQAVLHQQMGSPSESIELLKQARMEGSLLESEIAARWASQANEAVSDPAQPHSGEPDGQQIRNAWWEAANPNLPAWGNFGESHTTSTNRRYTQALKRAEYRCDPQAAGLFSSHQPDEEISDPGLLLEMARQSLKNNEIVQAMKQAQSALDLVSELRRDTAGKDDLQIMTDLGDLFLELGMPGQAAQAAQVCLALAPTHTQALAAAGKGFSGQKRFDRAVEPLLTGTLLFPEGLDGLRLLADTLEQAEAWDLALEERSKIADLSQAQGGQTVSSDLHSLAGCALQANAFQNAAEACELALELNAQDWRAHHLYGLVFKRMGDLPRAIGHFGKAIEIEPQKVECWLDLATAQQQTSGAEKASETLLAALQAVPDHPGLHLQYGEILLGQNAQTQALEAFQNAYELAKNAPTPDPITLEQSGIRLSQSLQALGHQAEARQIIEPIYRSQPKNCTAASIMGKILVAQQDYASALPALDTAIQDPANCSDSELLYAYGLALMEQKEQPNQAVRYLARSLEVNPESLETQTLLAEAFTAAQDFPAALEMYRKAIDSETVKSPRWQIRLSKGLGKTALALNLPDVALAAYQDAVNLEPGCVESNQCLAEANWLAGLGNHAWTAARNLIVLDSQPAIVTWFADKALEWSLDDDQESQPENTAAHSAGLISAARIRKTSNRTLSISAQEMLCEASIALHQARETYPDSPAVILRLGKIMNRLNNPDESASIFGELAQVAGAPIEALEEGASELLQIAENSRQKGDPASLQLAQASACDATYCLEKAAMLGSNDTNDRQAMRFVHLAEAHRQAYHLPEMLTCLEKALCLAPHQAAIHRALFQARVMEGNLDQALHVLKTADEQTREDSILAELHFTASKLCQDAGLLALAVFHAQAAESASKQRSSVDLKSLNESAILQQARLYRQLLLNNQARSTLMRISNNNLLNDQDIFEYACLQAETALDANEEIEAAFYLTKAISQDANHPWPMAIQARLLHQQKDQPLAVNAMKNLVASLPDDCDTPVYISIARTAADMAEWQSALALAERALKRAGRKSNSRTVEPQTALLQAEMLVRQAEFAWLCKELDVVQHTPGETAFDTAHQAQLMQSIQTAESALLQAIQDSGTFQNSPADTENLWQEATAEIARWKCRGGAAFNLYAESKNNGRTADGVPASWAVWTGFPISSADHSALLAHTRKDRNHPARQTSATQAREAVEIYPKDSQVLLQAALTLGLNAPAEALRYAQSARNLLANLPRHPLNILAHRLLAQLEKQNGNLLPALQAIHVALAGWPNEARWHNLAARIRMALPEILPAEVGLKSTPDAVAYLEEAICLEPEHADHAILMSKVIQNNVREDPQSIRKALKVLEKASSENPGNPAVWLALANLYRFTANKAAVAGKPERKLAASSAISAAACAERASTLAEDQNDTETGASAHILLGYLALAKSDPEEGYRQARQALRMQPTSSAAILLQVDCLEALGRAEDAIDLMNKSLSLGPNNLNIEIKRAALMSARSDQEKDQTETAKSATGLELLEKLSQQHPAEPKVHYALAKSLAAANRKEDAIQSAQAALTLTNTVEAGRESVDGTPGEKGTREALSAVEISELHALLGGLYMDLGHLDQSVHQFDTALAYNPENIEAYLALARTYSKQRQYLKTQEVLREAINAAPNDPRVYYQAGIVFKQGHNYKEAEAMLHKAASLAPDDVHIKRQLASIMAAHLMQTRQNPSQPANSVDGVS